MMRNTRRSETGRRDGAAKTTWLVLTPSSRASSARILGTMRPSMVGEEARSTIFISYGDPSMMGTSPSLAACSQNLRNMRLSTT